MDDSSEEMVKTVNADVDGEQEADEDLICKHDRCLHHMEAVACERRGCNGPARDTSRSQVAAIILDLCSESLRLMITESLVYCFDMSRSAGASLVVDVVYTFVQEPAVQHTVRPVEPCVMQVIENYNCQNDVQYLRMPRPVTDIWRHCSIVLLSRTIATTHGSSPGAHTFGQLSREPLYSLLIPAV